jgi:hypothetical protein
MNVDEMTHSDFLSASHDLAPPPDQASDQPAEVERRRG